MLLALACSAAPADSDEKSASSDEALTREAPLPVGVTQIERKECSKIDPLASVSPIEDQDPKYLAELAKAGCQAPFMYYTGSGAGLILARMSVCNDTPTARAYVASHAFAFGDPWSPPGFCDHALPVLPAGKGYVVWNWGIGPNCSGCTIGIRPWG